MDSPCDYLRALEEQLLEPVVRSDPDALSGLLADEMREFGSSGKVYTKREIVRLLAAEAPRKIALYDFTCRNLSPTIALVTYRSHSEAGSALRSSIWVYQDQRWQVLFHQGTKVPAPPVADAVS